MSSLWLIADREDNIIHTHTHVSRLASSSQQEDPRGITATHTKDSTLGVLSSLSRRKQDPALEMGVLASITPKLFEQV